MVNQPLTKLIQTRRLSLIAMALILMFGALILVAIAYIEAISSKTRHLYDHPFTVSTAILRVDGNIIRMHRSMKDVALARTQEHLQQARDKVDQLEQEVYNDLELVHKRFLGDKKRVESLRRLFGHWKPIRDEVIELSLAGKLEQAAEITKGKGARYVETLINEIHHFVEFARNKADTFHQEAISSQREALIFTSVWFVLIFFSGLILMKLHLRSERDLILARNIIENASDAILITDSNCKIIDINPSYKNITGYSLDEVLGRSPGLVSSGKHDKSFYDAMWTEIKQNGGWHGELWDQRKNGEVFPIQLSINVIRSLDGKTSNYVGIFQDISEHKKAQQKLTEMAFYDQLTHLANRSLFTDHLNSAIALSKRQKQPLALLFLDLDQFKWINDTLGHDTGDQLLQVVAERLVSCVRDTDTVARLGGDEFTVLLQQVRNADNAAEIAQNIIQALGEPVLIADRELNIGVSIGIAIGPDDGTDSSTLQKNADLAMYQAKQSGRNTYRFFSSALQSDAESRFDLISDLRVALQEKQFFLTYQPIVQLETGKAFSLEALIRWERPGHGLVPPDKFIPIAEETGIIVEMGEWILETACTEVLAFDPSGLCVAVNLSARQFNDTGLLAMVERVLRRTGFPAERLKFELTETAVMSNVEQAIDTMNKLIDLGISLAVDDFGTGYSSLSTLKRFPLSTLKIDKSFVRDLETDSDDAAIVNAIIAMSESLELAVIAEGVETEEQLQFLREKGCKYAQGFFFQRPSRLDELRQMHFSGIGCSVMKQSLSNKTHSSNSQT